MLAGVSDWSTAQPFLNVAKTARPWLGHTADTWGGISNATLKAEGYLDAQGYPTGLPPTCTSVESLILVGLPEGYTAAAGRYHVLWEGAGTVDFTGRATAVTTHAAGHKSFQFTPGPGTVGLRVTTFPVTNLRVIKEENLAETGLFDPRWLASIRNYKSLRFMDWQRTNNNTTTQHSDVPLANSYTWAEQSVPVSVMVDLANTLGRNPWFCIPHLWSPAEAALFAAEVEANLSPELVPYYEYSNEYWNYQFDQTQWLLDQVDHTGDLWMELGGELAAAVARAITAVDPRAVNVLAVHTGWQELEQAQLRADPTAFQAYAVAGYFGDNLSSEEAGTAVATWLATSEAYANEQVNTTYLQPSLTSLVGNWAYHRNVAEGRGLPLVMYEGGSHIVAPAGVRGNPAVYQYYLSLSYSPTVAAVYSQALEQFPEGYNVYYEAGAPGPHGAWGLRRWTGETNARATVVENFLRTTYDNTTT